MSFARWRDRLTLLLLALLPWQARWIGNPRELLGVPWEQGTASVFALELLTLAALLCHAAASGRGEEPRPAAPRWLKLAGLIPLWAFVSILWAGDRAAASFTAMHLFHGYALACLLLVSRVRLAQALAAFAGGAAASAALGLWQSFAQADFASTWLGVSAHPVQDPGTSVIGTAGGRHLRAYGSLPHPNILGGYAAAGLVAAFALASEEGRLRRWMPAFAAVLSAGLVASFSRSGWLAALVALAVGALMPRAVDAAARRRLLPTFAAAAVTALLVTAVSLPAVTSRVTGQGRLEAKSVDERSSAFLDGLSVVRADPAAGTGVGNYLPIANGLFGSLSDPYAVQPPHVVPLLVAAELGFLGLAVLVGALAAWWSDAAWLLRRARSPRVALAAALPIVLLVVSCFDHYPYDLFAGMTLVGALFGLFLKAGEESAA